MFFTEEIFPLFLAFVVLLFWGLPQRYKHPFLLVASYFFYGYNAPSYCFLLLGVSLLHYGLAIGIEKAETQTRKKILLWLAISLSAVMLGYFKYSTFVLQNLALIWPKFDVVTGIILPAGISFFTFQGLAYTADVYFGSIRAERNLITFLLFKAYFPQLVAGPIERSHNLLSQLHTPRQFSFAQFCQGLDLLLRGFVKKLVVADNIAVYVNMIFALKSPTTLQIVIGTIGFGVQILADFSAYTDIARGCAKMMGFELLENFNHPYLATSPADFWRRWHISLSNCIRDYIYLPLGGSRVTLGRWILNLLIVWLLCGLWHGASWNFVVWGLYWAFWIIIYRLTPSLPTIRSKVGAALLQGFRIALMFCIIHGGWLLFRVDSLSLLGKYFSKKALENSWQAAQLPSSYVILTLILQLGAVLVAMMLWKRFVTRYPAVSGQVVWARRLFVYVFGILAIWILKSEANVEFIYFQF